MKAIVQHAYGSSENLAFEEVERPKPGDGEILIRVCAASVHAGDYFMMRGEPYIARLYAGWPRPRGYIPGSDVAGTVAEVGNGVTRFKPGDEVFAECGGGACAEYVCSKEDHTEAKPASITFEQAAAVPVSALAALQGLRDAAKLRSGQRILINGASGGVGTYAVQIAKTLGAHVTGVCGPQNVEMVRSLGADEVIDYTREDFTLLGQRWDLILDNVGNRSLSDCWRVLNPDGIMLPNTGNAGMGYIMKAYMLSILVRRQGRPFLSSPNASDMAYLRRLLEAGELVPVIDRSYTLGETPAALDHIGKRHAKGKVVITVREGN